MSSNLPPIKVEFPDRMRVDAPETDQAIDALKAAFTSFSKQLEFTTGKMLTSLESLTQLPQMIANLQGTVATQFHELFVHEVKVAAAGRLATMQAAEKKRQAAQESLARRESRLGEERELLSGRYGKLLGQVAGDCESRIRQLDSHAFDIVEQAYPKQVQQRFELDSTPAVKLLAEHADESAAARTLCLGEKLESMATAVVGARTEIADFEAEAGRLASRGGPAVGWHRLSCTFLELEDAVTGERRFEVLLAGGESLESLGPEISTRLRQQLRAGTGGGAARTLAADDLGRLAETMAASGATPEDVRSFRDQASVRPIEWRSGGRP
jgi:hypothetical protein